MMRSISIVTIFILFTLIMDLYAYRGLQFLLGRTREGSLLFPLIFWGLSAAMMSAFLWAGFQFQKIRDPSRFFGVMLIMGLFLMVYTPILLLNLAQLLGDFAGLVFRLINPNEGAGTLRKYFMIPGAVAGILLFIAFGYGMLLGRTHLKVVHETIPVRQLPSSFHGFRVVQLSDLHLAGFYYHPGFISQVVEKVNRLEPDLILFTGDMVHNFSDELDPFVDVLAGLKAPLGKYAVLGNHDYGLYYRWGSPEEEAANLEKLKEQITSAGFDLLLNESRTLSLDGQTIEVIGVENWGKPPFPQKGDLPKALEGTDKDAVKILMSHDPSHWDLQVRGLQNIPLTLSGHTHGMQFGLEIGNFRWSPSRWTYKQWGGLYSEDGQYLYVNRGLGYTGFPGRVGIRPEITLLTLTGD